jgi:hypothetical protein
LQIGKWHPVTTGQRASCAERPLPAHTALAAHRFLFIYQWAIYPARMFLQEGLNTMLRLVALFAASAAVVGAESARPFLLRSNDVVAFVGGSDVAAVQFTGHVETLLAARFPRTRFRNFGWEGDTVFAQPRDIGFPPLHEHLRRAGATVLFLEFGRVEALSGKETAPAFFAAYERLVIECAKLTPRIVLVAPPPFEAGGGSLPDLSQRNASLAAHVNATRTLAQRRSLPIVNLFEEFGGASHVEPRLTDNGLQLTPRGHALLAGGVARQLGFGDWAVRAGDVDSAGAWSNSQIEKLRQTVIEKNRLWFNYWRPQNWAFLGGDRTTQPSSRDHRNPNVRWFPAEMEKYVPLIRVKEEEMERMAAMIRQDAR